MLIQFEVQLLPRNFAWYIFSEQDGRYLYLFGMYTQRPIDTMLVLRPFVLHEELHIHTAPGAFILELITENLSSCPKFYPKVRSCEQQQVPPA